MAKTPTSYMDLRLSGDAKSDLKLLTEYLAKNVKDINALTKGFQSLGTELKAVNALAAAQNKRGLEAYRSGVQTQARIKADNTSFQGTKPGREASEIAAISSQVDKVNKGYRLREQLEKAHMMNLTSETRLVQGLTTQAEIKSKKELLGLKIGQARLRDDQVAMAAASRLNSLLDQRSMKLKQIAQYNATYNKTTERQQMAEVRRKNQEKLFGDGGAGLFKIQTGLLANYMALNAARQLFSKGFDFSKEFDDSLRNLQAIARLSDNGLQDLKGTLIDVSEQTKFTAVEITNAAVTLAQAGLSIDQIKNSIGAVGLLATATGTDLAKAVDITTSVLGVFNMESGQMASVANTMTEAVNRSKLNIEKLTLGIQYAGNVSAQSGLRFEELTAALGSMANAGIRSGSTLGTGMRQVLISLQKPSKEFRETLARLGLTMQDVDLRSKGLFGVMTTLKEAGFSGADALKSFEIRGASAFKAMAGNLDDFQRLEYSFLNSNAAMAANETQMRSLANQMKKFGGVVNSVLATGFEPFLLMLRDLLGGADGNGGLSGFFQTLRKNEPMIRGVTSAVATLVLAFGGLKVIKLIGGLLFSLIPTVGTTSISFAALSAQWTLAGVTGMRFSMVLGLITAGMRALTLSIPLLGALMVAYMAFNAATKSYSDEAVRLGDTLDIQRAAQEKAQGAVENYRQKIEVVSGKIQELADREEYLSDNTVVLAREVEAVRSQFATMGYSLDTAATSVAGLIGKLRALRTQLAQGYTLKINIANQSIGALQASLGAQGSEAIQNIQGLDLSKAKLSPEQIAIIEGVQQSNLRDPAVLAQGQGKISELLEGVNDKASAAPNPKNKWDFVDKSVAKRQQKVLNDIMTQTSTIVETNQGRSDLEEVRTQNNAAQTDINMSESPAFRVQEETTMGSQNAVRTVSAEFERRQRVSPKEAANFFDEAGAPLREAMITRRDLLEKDPLYQGASGKALVEQLNQSISSLDSLEQGNQEELNKVNTSTTQMQRVTTGRALSSAKKRIGDADNPAQVNIARDASRIAVDADFEVARRQVMIGDEGKTGNDIPLEKRLKLKELDQQRTIALTDLDAQADEKIQALNKAKDSGGGGGGGSDKGQKFDFNLMMDRFKSETSAAELGVKNGNVRPEEGAGAMDKILAQANVELDKRAALIEKSRLNTSRSKTEEAELNQLVSEHGTLLTFIRGQEEAIIKLKEKHGLIQFNLNQSIQQWADKNLNMTNAMESGVSEVLSSMTSGFATLFTDLANGTKTAGAAFKDFAISVVKSLQQVIAKMIAIKIMQTIIGAIGGGGGGDLMGLFNSAMGISAPAAAVGGIVRKAGGGKVEGNLNRDSKLHYLMPGEYVLRKSAVDMMGTDQLNQINAMGNRKAVGGISGIGKKSGTVGTTNVWVVSPEQQPVPGPKDIVAIITDDMSRGGSTKRLIKSISMGNL